MHAKLCKGCDMNCLHWRFVYACSPRRIFSTPVSSCRRCDRSDAFRAGKAASSFYSEYSSVICHRNAWRCMKHHEAKWSNMSNCVKFKLLCLYACAPWYCSLEAETNLPLTPQWDCSHWGHHWRRSQTFLPVGDGDTSGSKALQFWHNSWRWKTVFDWCQLIVCLLLLAALIRAPPKCHAEIEMWLDGRSWSGTCRSPQRHSCIDMLILQRSLALQKHANTQLAIPSCAVPSCPTDLHSVRACFFFFCLNWWAFSFWISSDLKHPLVSNHRPKCL